MKPIEILIIEDNRGDVVLFQEALNKAGINHHLMVVRDGMEAMEYLRRKGKYAGVSAPEMMILDLKLPCKSGREVLAELRPMPDLREIPVVVLSSSRSELELARGTLLPRQRCLVKPSTFDGYVDLVRNIESWRLALDAPAAPASG